jgi:hypothetical protein
MQTVSASGPATSYYTWRFRNKTWNLRRGAYWPAAYFRVVDRPCGPLTGSPRERIRKVSHNMLQTIYKNYRAREASSLYCVWTTCDGTPGSPLIAVWIDPSMRAFEGESPSAAQSDSEAVSTEEPGSCACTGATVWPQTKRNWNLSHGEESVENRVAENCP